MLHTSLRPKLRGSLVAVMVAAMALLLAACGPSDIDVDGNGDEEVVDPVELPDHLAIYLDEPPEIDGDLDDWPTLDALVVANSSDLYQERDGWADREDHGMWLWIGWDAENLYLAIQRTDDELTYDVADSIEDAREQDAISLYFAAGIRDDEPTVFHFSTIDGEPTASHENISYAVSQQDELQVGVDVLSGEIHEIAIPAELLPVAPAEDADLRFLPVSTDVDGEREGTVLTYQAISPQLIEDYALLGFAQPVE